MANNTFNFTIYNDIIKTAGTGLRLHLGVQMIKDVVDSLERFDNPLEMELRAVYDDLKDVHRKYKEAAKKLAEKRTNDAEAAKAGGNPTQAELNELQQIVRDLTEKLNAKNAA